MVFTETKLFTKLIYRYLTDDELSELQDYLAGTPEILKQIVEVWKNG